MHKSASFVEKMRWGSSLWCVECRVRSNQLFAQFKWRHILIPFPAVMTQILPGGWVLKPGRDASDDVGGRLWERWERLSDAASGQSQPEAKGSLLVPFWRLESHVQQVIWPHSRAVFSSPREFHKTEILQTVHRDGYNLKSLSTMAESFWCSH